MINVVFDFLARYRTCRLLALNNFVDSVEKSLFDYAVNFYRDRGKNVKRKRGKLMSQAKTAFTATGLSPLGWLIRYDYKMGVFAELMQDAEFSSR
jgi:hypothetical protein